jgi:outer membrane protein|tara:strand:+ start:675 stop:1205 length:531 start_codon:yes stop_codon:yes gene_type:complete
MKYFKFFEYILILFILLQFNTAYSNEKIFYIDMDFIMNNSLAGKSIMKQMDKKKALNIKNFMKQEETLKKEENKLISQKNVLDKKKFEEQVNAFQNKVSDYKSNSNKIANEFSKKLTNAQKKLTNTLTPILANYSAQNSISFIIPKKNIIIGKTELDLTNTILKLLDSKVKSIEIK